MSFKHCFALCVAWAFSTCPGTGADLKTLTEEMYWNVGNRLMIDAAHIEKKLVDDGVPYKDPVPFFLDPRHLDSQDQLDSQNHQRHVAAALEKNPFHMLQTWQTTVMEDYKRLPALTDHTVQTLQRDAHYLRFLVFHYVFSKATPQGRAACASSLSLLGDCGWVHSEQTTKKCNVNAASLYMNLLKHFEDPTVWPHHKCHYETLQHLDAAGYGDAKELLAVYKTVHPEALTYTLEEISQKAHDPSPSVTQGALRIFKDSDDPSKAYDIVKNWMQDHHPEGRDYIKLRNFLTLILAQDTENTPNLSPQERRRDLYAFLSPFEDSQRHANSYNLAHNYWGYALAGAAKIFWDADEDTNYGVDTDMKYAVRFGTSSLQPTYVWNQLILFAMEDKNIKTVATFFNMLKSSQNASKKEIYSTFAEIFLLRTCETFLFP